VRSTVCTIDTVHSNVHSNVHNNVHNNVHGKLRYLGHYTQKSVCTNQGLKDLGRQALGREPARSSAQLFKIYRPSGAISSSSPKSMGGVLS
jgi:hypothetical protein